MPKKKTLAPGSEMFMGGHLVETEPDGLDGLAAAIGKCRGDDPCPGAVEDLRRLLLAAPRRAFGLSAKQARQYAARFAAGGDDAAVRTMIEVEAGSMEAELREDTDGPLVRAACRHAADARLILDGVQRGYVSSLTGTFYRDSATMWDCRKSAAQTRYLRALATVAKLREVEAKERRRADRHGLQMDAARRVLPPRGDRRSVYADLPVRAALPARSGEALPSPEAGEVMAAP